MKKYSTLLLMVLCNLSLFAQSGVEMATDLRSSGKIYVVALVLLTIFIGIGIYLIALDRRIKKLEKETKK